MYKSINDPKLIEAWIQEQTRWDEEREEIGGRLIHLPLYDSLAERPHFGPVHEMFCTPLPSHQGKTLGQVLLEQGAIEDWLLADILGEEVAAYSRGDLRYSPRNHARDPRNMSLG